MRWARRGTSRGRAAQPVLPMMPGMPGVHLAYTYNSRKIPATKDGIVTAAAKLL